MIHISPFLYFWNVFINNLGQKSKCNIWINSEVTYSVHIDKTFNTDRLWKYNKCIQSSFKIIIIQRYAGNISCSDIAGTDVMWCDDLWLWCLAGRLPRRTGGPRERERDTDWLLWLLVLTSWWISHLQTSHSQDTTPRSPLPNTLLLSSTLYFSHLINVGREEGRGRGRREVIQSRCSAQK